MAQTAPSEARARPESEPQSSWEPPCHPSPRRIVRHVPSRNCRMLPSPVAQTSSEETTSSPPTGEPSPRSGADHTRCIRSPSSRSSPEESATTTSVPTMPTPTSEGSSTCVTGCHSPDASARARPSGPTTHTVPSGATDMARDSGFPRRWADERRGIARQDSPSNRRTSSPKRTSTPPVGSATSSSANGRRPGPVDGGPPATVEPHHRLLQLAVGEQDLPDGPHMRPRCRW